MTMEEARRLLARARAVLGSILAADPDEPLPKLPAGVPRRLHTDIAAALTDEEIPAS